MIATAGPVTQALLGTLLTWGLTAAGAALVFLPMKGDQKKILDGSLGFAAGVMLAASYWSLLAPAIDIASSQGYYGEHVWCPVAFGFFLGALFVHGADKLLPTPEGGSSAVELAQLSARKENVQETSPGKDVRQRRRSRRLNPDEEDDASASQDSSDARESSDAAVVSESAQQQSMSASSWRRMLLLILAITVHNLPEGLAVGVAFGGIGSTESATFAQACSLALGIGIQNFPEGLAVSLPLKAAGFSTWKSFWYGQLSGMVEPVAGVLGAVAVTFAAPLLPYALAFAAGAMVFVVADDILPEAQTGGNGRLASWGTIVGFIVMMTLDVALG
eukprot:scpid69187/ scgid30516/ Zinc transporter ZIP11; Solute carrier family 39 member 11; Zrt- and Irt-like protein 11